MRKLLPLLLWIGCGQMPPPVAGPASQGLVGDYFMRNDKIRVVVQAPGRAIGPCPFGGNIIDVDRVDGTAGDQLGEVAPFLQLGRTVDFRRVEVVRDGSMGGAAVLRFRGKDAVDDFINVTGLGGFAQALQDDYRPTVDLGLSVAVTYVLEPGATHVQILYTFYNPAATDRKTLFGTISDTGAQIEVLHPGIGFGEFGIGDLFGATKIPLVEYAAFQGDGIAYGILPRFADANVRGFPFPVAGVDVEAYDVKDKADVLGPSGQSLTIPSLGGANRKVELIVGRDAGDVDKQVRDRKGQATTAVSGKVTTSMGGQPVAGARVAVENADVFARDPAHALVTVMVSAADGSWSGALPPGNYRVTAEGAHYLRGDAVNVTVGATAVTGANVAIPDAVQVDYQVHDHATGTPIPAKVMIVGQAAAPPDKRFRDTTIDAYPLGIAGWIASREGDSTKNTRWDHPLFVKPGHYRVVIGRGPEWSRFEKVVDLALGTPRLVEATLDRVVDTTGYVACDFHQHTYMSPDSPVPPADRVVTYLAEGLEFVSTSEHDVHFDYKPVIKALGVDRYIDSVVGVEVTPFAYGHFIGFPVRVDPLSPNGGAVDWAEHPMTGLDLAPADIFAGLRGAGAQVVQVNHPRAIPGSDVTAGFQKNFDRAALGFDFKTRSFGGNPMAYPVKAIELGLPDGAQIFSPSFDTLEVTNGWSFRVAGDERVDALTDNILKDWMNFLSFGFSPTAVGNSDSHQWVRTPAGLPRSLVRVPDDSAAAIMMGVGSDVVQTVTGKAAGGRDVIVTNTPLIKIAVDDKGIGAVVAHTGGGPLKLTVHVESPSWAPVDTVEIFANNTFDIPLPKGMMPVPLVPALCYTARGAPTARCSAATVGGKRPLTVQKVDVVSGVQRLQIDITEMVDPAQLIAAQRSGAQGKDLWLVARVTGDVALFPTIPDGIVDPNDIPGLVDGTVGTGKGVPAFAFTNPVFVDVDGGGWRAPFAP